NYPWELTAVQKSAERRLPPPPPPPDKTDTPTPPPPQPRVSAVHDCDRLAARPDDPFNPAQVPGVGFKQINGITAIQACRQAVETYAVRVPTRSCISGRSQNRRGICLVSPRGGCGLPSGPVRPGYHV